MKRFFEEQADDTIQQIFHSLFDDSGGSDQASVSVARCVRVSTLLT